MHTALEEKKSLPGVQTEPEPDSLKIIYYKTASAKQVKNSLQIVNSGGETTHTHSQTHTHTDTDGVGM